LTKAEIESFFKSKLDEDEKLTGFFQAAYMPSFWWYFLVGPLIFLGMRVYYIGLTSKGVHFQKLNLLGKMDIYNFFKNDEISDVKISKGWLQVPIKFFFSNDRVLKLKAQKKGVDKIAKINDSMINEILKLQANV